MDTSYYNRNASALPLDYHSYMLRLWREGPGLRIMVEAVNSGERHGFSSLEGLLEFLAAQLDEEERTP